MKTLHDFEISTNIIDNKVSTNATVQAKCKAKRKEKANLVEVFTSKKILNDILQKRTKYNSLFKN